MCISVFASTTQSYLLRVFPIMQPRKLSGHSVFSGERLREAGGSGLNVQLIKEIPSMWKALSDDEKKVCV